MRRVLIIGSGGSGKSTLARRLSELTGLPLVGLDFIYWRPGWVEPSKAEWRATVQRLVAEPAWVMDGNYGGSFDLRMPRADTAVWLDYPRATCLRRAVMRTLKNYGHSRWDLPHGCPERFDLEFLRWVWDFPQKSRRQIVDGLDRFGAHLCVVRLANDSDARAFLRQQQAA
jgi:adenylate kinase family enzyme